MTEYGFPRWRQIPFVAVLIVILVISFAPSITQGKVNVRIYALIPQGIVSHVYVKFSSLQLHTSGLPQNSGLVTLNQLLPRVDLVPIPGQYVPNTILSTSVTSGRYDAITLSFANSTIILVNGQKTAIPTGPTLAANVTVPIPPNGNGDVLIVLSMDYSLLLSSNPSISATIFQVTAFS